MKRAVNDAKHTGIHTNCLKVGTAGMVRDAKNSAIQTKD